MTRAQKCIYEYVQQDFSGKDARCVPLGGRNLKVTDKTGLDIILSMNIYGDIINEKTKDIIAISNLPHDIDKIGIQMPTNWTSVDESNITIPKLVEADMTVSQIEAAEDRFIVYRQQAPSPEAEIKEPNTLALNSAIAKTDSLAKTVSLDNQKSKENIHEKQSISDRLAEKKAEIKERSTEADNRDTPLHNLNEQLGL